MRLPNTAQTTRPWPLTCVAVLPATAVAVGSYLKARVAGTRPTFITPPPDSMGP